MPNETTGAFLPTSSSIDPTQIYSTDINSRQFKDLIVSLSQTINNMSTMINTKSSGILDITEFVTGEQFFRNPALDSTTAVKPQLRTVFGKVIDFGTLPNAGVKGMAHGITVNASTSFIQILGCATNPTTKTAFSFPYAVCGGKTDAVEVWTNDTNVYVDTCASDRTGYTKCYIILKYLKF